MNERMNELARQSGISFLSNVPPDMLDKFAELIVQECAYINFYKRTDISLKDAYRVSKVILEHFGVEE